MAAFNKYQIFVEDLAEGIHDLDTHAINVALTNTAPNAATHALLADIAEISAGNGYSAGGAQATLVSSAHSSGTYKLVLNDVTFTASGGSIGPFRYAVLYNDGTSGKVNPLIGWWDYGTNVTITDGNSFLVDLSAANGVLQLT